MTEISPPPPTSPDEPASPENKVKTWRPPTPEERQQSIQRTKDRIANLTPEQKEAHMKLLEKMQAELNRD